MHVHVRINDCSVYGDLTQGLSEDDDMTLGASPGSAGADALTVGSAPGSDVSWEAVNEGDADMTLWVPDHVVTHCASCHQKFSLVRRKHHCR